MDYHRQQAAFALILSAFLFSASNAHSVAHNLSGAWAGVAIGSALSGSTNYLATQNEGGATTELLKNNAPLKGFLGEVVAGVQKDFGSVVLGAELAIGAGAAKTSKKVNDLQVYKADQKAVLEAVARLGYKITDTIQIYSRVGGAMTAFDRQIPADEALTGVKIKQSKKLLGVVLGFGVEAKVMEQYLIGIEAKQTSYKEDAATETAGLFTVTDTFKPKVVAVMLRFSYKIT